MPSETPTPTETATPTPTATGTPTPTATPEPVVITGTEPPSAICRQELLIRGSGFGSSRQEVSGAVRITGVEVQDYIAWSPTEIRVVVPPSVRPGDGELAVDVSGHTARFSLRVSC